MLGLMQQRPLLVSSLVDYASTWHGTREIVSRDADGAFHRSTFAEVAARAKRVANALSALGTRPGDRIATLAWNSHRHLELYYGVTSSGRVLHTVNPRLFPDQIQYIMHHAEDAYVFFDPVFAPLVEALAPRLPLARGWVALCDAKAMPAVKGVSASLLRGPAGGGLGGIRVAAHRREHGLDALLHLRHHRQSEGRDVQPPLDGAARLRRLLGRRARAVGPQLDPRRRAPLSRQRLEPPVLRGDVRGEAGASRSKARSREHFPAARSGGVHQGGRHPDDLAQFPRLAGGQSGKTRSVAAETEAGLLRRHGAAARHDREVPRSYSASSCCTPGA